MTEEWLNAFDFMTGALTSEEDVTPLPPTFTIERIEKCIGDIKSCEELYNLDVEGTQLYTDDWTQPLKEQNLISLRIPIKTKTNNKLNRVFHNGLSEVGFTWVRSEKNRRYWYLARDGRPLCGNRYVDVITEKYTHDTCYQCPSEFRDSCKGLTNILKKHSL